MAFVPFTKEDKPTMAAFNEKYQEAISEAISEAIEGAPHIEVGSYVGTGTYGSSNPNSLTFGFEPKFLFISCIGMASLAVGLLSESYVTRYHIYNGSGLQRGDLKIKKDGNSIIWYSSSGSPAATWAPYNQMNIQGVTYDYIAIG